MIKLSGVQFLTWASGKNDFLSCHQPFWNKSRGKRKKEKEKRKNKIAYSLALNMDRAYAYSCIKRENMRLNQMHSCCLSLSLSLFLNDTSKKQQGRRSPLQARSRNSVLHDDYPHKYAVTIVDILILYVAFTRFPFYSNTWHSNTIHLSFRNIYIYSLSLAISDSSC